MARRKPFADFSAPDGPSDEPGRARPSRAHLAPPTVSQATRIAARSKAGARHIDPDLIDDDFGLKDRMDAEDDADQKLLESILAHGQLVPALVRPSPRDDQRYQIVFGRRRLQAVRKAREINPDIQFLAIVKPLNDEDFVIAQGVENNTRKDLSFLEKCRFAQAIAESGYSQEVVASAINSDRTLVTKMLGIVGAIDHRLLDAIGSAPGIGRPRWAQLAEILSNSPDMLAALLTVATDRKASSSNDRFLSVLKAAQSAQTQTPTPASGKIEGGSIIVQKREVARFKRSVAKLSIELPRGGKGDEGFTNWVSNQLPEIINDLHDRYRTETSGEED